eukprot:TRINITY_DN633_c0_g1_i1.p1 TRINITY_DN633_c0_g1~~TRINITY_DN633_c0_g1_i1.p1  ORF type:complete len:305 (+),score=57.11 TRINITY_DN633_c0_g1_i1:45-917(+)
MEKATTAFHSNSAFLYSLGFRTSPSISVSFRKLVDFKFSLKPSGLRNSPLSRGSPTRCSNSEQIAGARTPAVKLEPSFAMKNKAAEISNELKGTSIFLLGMNGTMKANLGKLLADVLRYYYFDSDSLVEEAGGGDTTGKSFREIDEQGFRDSETEVLKQLSSMGRLVVCVGDGAVQSSTNLTYLRYGVSIWIDVPLDMLANETKENRVPQAVSTLDSLSEVLAKLTKQYSEMRGGYATADATISLQRVASELSYDNVNMVTPEDMAVEVLKEIERLTRVKKMMEEAARPF